MRIRTALPIIGGAHSNNALDLLRAAVSLLTMLISRPVSVRVRIEMRAREVSRLEIVTATLLSTCRYTRDRRRRPVQPDVWSAANVAAQRRCTHSPPA